MFVRLTESLSICDTFLNRQQEERVSNAEESNMKKLLHKLWTKVLSRSAVPMIYF